MANPRGSEDVFPFFEALVDHALNGVFHFMHIVGDDVVTVREVRVRIGAKTEGRYVRTRWIVEVAPAFGVVVGGFEPFVRAGQECVCPEIARDRVGLAPSDL